jgi:glycolate oxidase FAD binding subunit
LSRTLRPESQEELTEALRWAVSEKAPLEVIGGGTRRAFGPPVQAAATLDASAISGIVSYEPEELVLTLRPGTPMSEVDEALNDAGQMLAFEPPDLSPLLGAEGVPTFGGVYATNLSGPRRLSAGAVRDHILGLHAVSGRAEAFKAGGNVVKNVTGYDLARALTGSWGTLAVATEITVKVLPRPETETTVTLADLSANDAVAALSRALGSPADVSGAAHLPADVAPEVVEGAAGPLTLVRLEGFGPSVAARSDALVRLFAEYAVGTLDAAASRAAWQRVRNVTPFAGGGRAVWRCSVPPTAGPSVAAAAPAGSRAYFDWGGGLIWIETAADGDAGTAAIRAAVASAGSGHATLVAAPLDVRAAVPTFHPVEGAAGALAGRLKAAFDPEGILNPGRMGR